MLDHPNLMFAKALWTAVAEGDAEALRELLHPDVVWHVEGQHPLAGDHAGPEGVLDYLASIGERADDLRTELIDVWVNEGGAIVAYHVQARRELKRLDADFYLELTVEDGRMLRARTTAVDPTATNQFWT